MTVLSSPSALRRWRTILNQAVQFVALVGAIVALPLATASCDDSVGPSEALFAVTVSGETFRIRATDPLAIAALQARLSGGQPGVVNGRLVAGDGGFNEPWAWHLDPASIEVPDATIELCDGRPSMVEADLGYWLGTVGRFCPWGALVVSRLE